MQKSCQNLLCTFLSATRVIHRFNKLGIMALQLVQFLLKQAGVDKRTGDLYGNRDFLNIARNMARGLKVCLRKLYFMLSSIECALQAYR